MTPQSNDACGLSVCVEQHIWHPNNYIKKLNQVISSTINFTMKTTLYHRISLSAILFSAFFLTIASAKSQTSGNYQIFVSNEKGGTLTVINGTDFKVTDTIPVGKRPRGIHASPDGKLFMSR